MRIKKISPTTPANGNIENQYGTSQTNAYSEAYANTTFATKDVATTSANGLMSSSDKETLGSIATFMDNFLNVPASTLTDLNTTSPGIRKYATNTTNAPTTTSGKCITFKITTNDYVYQICFCDYTMDIYTRYRYYSSGWKWSGWAKLNYTWVS